MDYVIALRMLERVIAVVIGGLAIYLGYRLFLHIPQATDSEGKFTLPWNTTIALTRVGPGVFFALFGSIVVGVSLYRSIDYSKPGESARFIGATQVAQNSDEIRDARMLLQRDIAVLNTVPSQLNPSLEAHNRSSVERAIHRVKLALMEKVWAEDWGDRSALKLWMDSPDPAAPPGIREGAEQFYRQGSSSSP